ncbi:hypothetical protein SALBM217S_07037 [Streptomyces griseoloalbus]
MARRRTAVVREKALDRRPQGRSARPRRTGAPRRPDHRHRPACARTGPRDPAGAVPRARARGARRQARGGRRQGHGDRRRRRRSRRDDARTARDADRTGRRGHRRRSDRTEADRRTARGLRRTTGRHPRASAAPSTCNSWSEERGIDGDEAVDRQRRTEQPHEARTAPADHETDGAQPAEPDAVPGGRGRGRRHEPPRHQEARRPHPGRTCARSRCPGSELARTAGAGAPATTPAGALARTRHAARPPRGRGRPRRDRPRARAGRDRRHAAAPPRPRRLQRLGQPLRLAGRQVQVRSRVLPGP